MKIGFDVKVGVPGPAITEKEGERVGRGTYDHAMGIPKWGGTTIDCPMCFHRLREVLNARDLKAGRIVADQDGKIALDVLPDNMRLLRCGACDIVFYQPKP